MTDKEIQYFISSYSIDKDGVMTFMWPLLPDLEMGDEFIKKIKAQFSEIDTWIKNNPKRFLSAQNGYYTPDIKSTNEQPGIL